jgi:hypothetical protein
MAAEFFADFSKNGRKVAEHFCCVKDLNINRKILHNPRNNSTFLLLSEAEKLVKHVLRKYNVCSRIFSPADELFS